MPSWRRKKTPESVIVARRTSLCALCGNHYVPMPLQVQARCCSVCAMLYVIVIVKGQNPEKWTKGMLNAPNKWWENPDPDWIAARLAESMVGPAI